jgi:hypothetical protein
MMDKYKIKFDLNKIKKGEIVNVYFDDNFKHDKKSNLHIYFLKINGVKYGSAITASENSKEGIINKLFEKL